MTVFRRARSALAGGLLVLTLAACAAPVVADDVPASPAPASPHPSPVADEASGTPAPASTPTDSFADRLPLSGSFVSQGASTTGTVSIRNEADGRITIVLTGFSTGDGDDLRIWLNPAPLVHDADGQYYVDGNSQYEIAGTVDPARAEQSFELPAGVPFPAGIQSVTVYDYANRIALGSANLA